MMAALKSRDDVLAAFAESYREALPNLPGHALGHIRGLRNQAMDRFLQLGLPQHPKGHPNEAWKYARLAPLARHIAVAHTSEKTIVTAPEHTEIPKLNAIEIVLVNGQLHPKDAPDALPAGITLIPLHQAITEQHPSLIEALESSLKTAEDGVALLNLALMQGGFVLNIKAGTVADQPLHIHHITTNMPKNSANHTRHFIHAGADSHVTLVEHYISDQHMDGWHNTLTHVVLERNATLTHTTLQQEGDQMLHTGAIHASVGEHATYQHFLCNMGATQARRELHTHFTGEHGKALQHGIVLGCRQQQMDHYLPCTHNRPNCYSEQTYKAVLDTQAQGIFYGKIIVPKHSPGNNAQQQSRALLLSPMAEADNRPELAIDCDDVICSHGAAIGDLDTEALYYLQARGISEAEARQLLVEGYLNDVIDLHPHAAIRDYLQQQVAAWLQERD